MYAVFTNMRSYQIYKDCQLWWLQSAFPKLQEACPHFHAPWAVDFRPGGLTLHLFVVILYDSLFTEQLG